MKFMKREICGMYTIAQAIDISSQFDDDPEWDFWKFIIDTNNNLFQVLDLLYRRCNDPKSKSDNPVV